MDGPRISARAFIPRDGEVLVAGYRDELGPWYVLPGGGQRRGESLHECLAREVKEEGGIAVSIGPLRWVREFVSANHPESSLDESFHQVEVIFECTLADCAEASLGHLPDPGQTGMHWFSIEELGRIRFYPNELAQILAGRIADRTYLGDSR